MSALTLTSIDPCFAAGTLVHTKDGLKKIEDIQIGDLVLSFPDNQTPPGHIRQENEYAYREVTKVSVQEDREISFVTVFDLAAGIKETIGATPNHRVYEKNSGWLPVSELKFGSAFENAVFGNLLVTKVKHSAARAVVYGLAVAEFQTYYVGQLGAWVHS
jgi:hypothetical protein